MIPVEALLDAYINANILLLIAFALWHIVRMGMRRFGLQGAHGIQLGLLNVLFVAIVSAPLIAAGFGALQQSGVAKDVSLNLSDIVVSHYLNGGFQMKAADLEGLVTTRDTFVLNLLNMQGWFAKLAIGAFLIGLGIGLVRLTYSIICLSSIVMKSYALRSFGRLRIRLSDRTLVPFSTRGLRNYYIVIPTDMLGQEHELKVSLAHEIQHIRQGDLEWEILLEALKPLFFLNPAYHAWKRQVEHLRELNCDNQVLGKGRINARMYCETLLAVCQKTLRRDRAFVIAVPKVALVTAERSSLRDRGPSFLERRVVSVLNMHKLRHPRLVHLGLALPMIGAIVLTSLAIQRPGDWSQDRLMLSTVVNLDRLNEINQQASFGRD